MKTVINIKNLVGKVNIINTDDKSFDDIQKRVTESLLKAVNNVNGLQEMKEELEVRSKELDRDIQAYSRLKNKHA